MPSAETKSCNNNRTNPHHPQERLEAQCTKASSWDVPLLATLCTPRTAGEFCIISLLFQQSLLKFYQLRCWVLCSIDSPKKRGVLRLENLGVSYKEKYYIVSVFTFTRSKWSQTTQHVQQDKAERKKIVVSIIPTDQWPKPSTQKMCPGFSRQIIHSVNFINFFHSLFTYFSVCLCGNLISVKANMLFMSYFWTSGPKTSDVIWSWSRLLCNSFSSMK